MQSGRKFTPRGNNWVRLALLPRRDSGDLEQEHATFEPGLYDAEAAVRVLVKMRQDGYNVVRVFLSHRMANPSGPGLDPAYLANVADFLKRARQEEVYVMLALSQFLGRNYPVGATNPQVEKLNNLFLTQGGIDARKRLLADFLTGMTSVEAPLEQVFLYGVVNEMYFRQDQNPLNLATGTVETLTGVYDMARAEQKALMMAHAVTHFANQTRSAIRALDATALVTVGFYSPRSVGPPDKPEDPRIVPPAVPPAAASDLDAIDLHMYPVDGDFATLAASLELTPEVEKPVVLGELGETIARFPDVRQAAIELRNWQVESCKLGVLGWILWSWDDYEITPPRQWWSALDRQGAVNGALAPVRRPDPCTRLFRLVSPGDDPPDSGGGEAVPPTRP